MSTIQELLQDSQLGHDSVQIASFMIVRNGGTKWGCYKQALAELKTRVRTAKRVILLRQEMLESLEATEGIKRAKVELDLQEAEESLMTVLRETAIIYQIADALKEQIDAVGELTPERRVELDKELWIHRLKEQLASDFRLNGGRLQPETEKSIRALPKDMRRIVHMNLTSPEALKAWYDEGDDTGVPEVTSPSDAALEAIYNAVDPGKSLDGCIERWRASSLQLLDSKAT